MTNEYTVLSTLFHEALVWGMTYGPKISAKQWDEMRESTVKQYVDRAMHVAQTAGAHQGVGNSGFDHGTAADFLNGKNVSDEAVRKFVSASRWAHDDRASLRAQVLSMRGELASREAEIALLKKALMDAEETRAKEQK